MTLLQDMSAAASAVTCIVRDHQRWTTLALTDVRLRYRRTVVGPWWMTLSTGATIAAVGLLYSGIFSSTTKHYLPFFAIGMILWTFIAGLLTESCHVFVGASGMIKSMPVPLLLHVFRLITRHLLFLAHNIVLILLLWVINPWPIDRYCVFALLGVAILFLTLLGAVLVLAVLCTRFRDIQQITSAVLQLMFLLTPIIWTPSSVGGSAATIVVDLNPLFYIVSVVRGPLIGEAPSLHVWLMALACAFASVATGLAVFGRFRHRVAYWL